MGINANDATQYPGDSRYENLAARGGSPLICVAQTCRLGVSVRQNTVRVPW